MKPSNIRLLASILLLSQLRLRSDKGKRSTLRTPKGLALIDALVFLGCFLFVYLILFAIPMEDSLPVRLLSTQIMSFLPIITLSFMILYSIIFIIGESAQFSSSEIINYMPITATEFVLASSLSTAFMYLYILTAVLGVSLGLAIHFGAVGIWALAAILSAFFMIVGGFVGEIIRATINRASSSFSKRGGRSAIITRAVLIVVILALSQLFFNPNLMFRLLQSFAPQMYALRFVPVMWPSLVVLELVAGNVMWALIYFISAVMFGLSMMAIGIVLRKRYWVPLPVTIRLSAPKEGKYSRVGWLGKLGFTAPESAIMRKDMKSLLRRKEMVRFLALPIIILIPLLLTYTGIEEIEATYFLTSVLSFTGAGMTALFLSIIAIGQEGPAIWSLYSAPLSAAELFKAKIALPVMLSLIPGIALPVVISILYGLPSLVAFGLTCITVLICALATFTGSYYGSKYCDIEEKPRSTYVRGTGMLLAFLLMGALGLLGGAPILLYLFMKPFALSIGLTSTYCLIASIAVYIALLLPTFKLASSSMKQRFSEFTGA